MSTTAFQMSDFTAALKQVIQPYISDNVPKQAKFLQVLQKSDPAQFFNNTFYIPVRTNRHGGVVNLSNPNAKLRTGFAPTASGTVGPKYLSATFDINDVVMKASANNRGAVESAMTMQMKTIKNDFSKNVNRQYFSDGYGIIGQVAGSVGAGTLSVKYPDASLDDGRSIEWYGTINGDIKPTKYLAGGTAGMAIGIGTAGADVGTISTVQYVSGSIGTVVVTGAPAIVAEDSLYLVDGDEGGAGTSEIQGFRLAITSGTADYAGIARSNDIWQGQVMGTSANAALTLADMESIYLSAYEYAMEGDRYAWFVNRSLYQKFGDLLVAMRREPSKTELVSGWSGLKFEVGQGEVGVFLDYDVPDGEAVLVNLDTWTVCEVAPMGFVEDNALRRADYITFQKVWSWYTNLICSCPAANGRMVRRTK